MATRNMSTNTNTGAAPRSSMASSGSAVKARQLVSDTSLMIWSFYFFNAIYLWRVIVTSWGFSSNIFSFSRLLEEACLCLFECLPKHFDTPFF